MEQVRRIWQKKWMFFSRGLITSDELCQNLIDYPFDYSKVDEQPNIDEFSQEMKQILKSYIMSRLPYTITEITEFSVGREEELQKATRRWFERLAESLQIEVSWNDERKYFERRPSGRSRP